MVDFTHFSSCFHTVRSEEHTSELQSRQYLVCRLLLEKKNVALTVGVFLLLFGAGLWAFTRMGHRFAMVERGVGLVKKKRRIAFSVFFFNDTATTEIYTLSLHDALPIFLLLHPYVPALRQTSGSLLRPASPL